MIHRHRFEVVDVQHFSVVPRPGRNAPVETWRTVAELPGAPVTTVLYRCSKCSKVQTEDIDGKWTVAQLTRGER